MTNNEGIFVVEEHFSLDLTNNNSSKVLESKRVADINAKPDKKYNYNMLLRVVLKNKFVLYNIICSLFF